MDRPTREEALKFATLMQAGMPSEEAIFYFFPDLTTSDEDLRKLRVEHDRWSRSRAVKDAVREVRKWDWEDLSLDDMVKQAVDKTYKEMAYFLHSRNYVSLPQAERQKADTCRTALEAKLAGSAGKTNELTMFFDDIMRGTRKLAVLPSSSIPPVGKIN